VEESIDYVLKPVLIGEAAENLGDLKGVAVPVRMSGNLYEPAIKVDIVAALAASQKEKLTKKADEYIGNLLGGDDSSTDGDKEGDSNEKSDVASSLLKGLLGGKKKSDKDKDGDGGTE